VLNIKELPNCKMPIAWDQKKIQGQIAFGFLDETAEKHSKTYRPVPLIWQGC
jgi:hypothetical protein